MNTRDSQALVIETKSSRRYLVHPGGTIEPIGHLAEPHHHCVVQGLCTKGGRTWYRLENLTPKFPRESRRNGLKDLFLLYERAGRTLRMDDPIHSIGFYPSVKSVDWMLAV